MIAVLGWVLAAAIIVNGVVFVLLLASSRRNRGGDVDLTAAAARGELDLTWDWPAGTGPLLEPFENGDDLSAPTTWAA